MAEMAEAEEQKNLGEAKIIENEAQVAVKTEEESKTDKMAAVNEVIADKV